VCVCLCVCVMRCVRVMRVLQCAFGVRVCLIVCVHLHSSRPAPPPARQILSTFLASDTAEIETKAGEVKGKLAHERGKLAEREGELSAVAARNATAAAEYETVSSAMAAAKKDFSVFERKDIKYRCVVDVPVCTLACVRACACVLACRAFVPV
jgi:hypothetical protein